MQKRDPIDVSRVATYLRTSAADWPQTGRARLMLWARSVLVYGAMFVVVLPLVLGHPGEIFDIRSAALWYRLATAVVLAAIGVAYGDYLHRSAQRDPHAAASRLISEVQEPRGMGWILRTIRVGILMGLGIGIPVGLLLSLLPADSFSERAEAFALFVGLTLLWTQPAAFGIRWLSVYSARRYLKRLESSAS
jgi:hypothetical protein